MSTSVLLGVIDPTLAAEMRAVVGEAGDYVVLGLETTSGDLLAAVERTPPEVLMLHERVGPMPYLDVVRDVAQRFPQVAVVVLVREGTAEILNAAMESGARAVLTLPLTVEETGARLAAATAISRSVGRMLAGDLAFAGSGGRLVLLAGAKGGVGTSTLAVQLALLAAQVPERRTCLVDLDLQTGDIASLLNITTARSIVDLAEVADDLSPRVVEEACFVHPSGLRVLLAPAMGERAEDVSQVGTRAVLSALRSRFDVVIADAGAVVTDASVVAVELADVVLVVVTPDVLALRAAQRLTKLWGRLRVRKESDLMLVINQHSRNFNYQPDLARRVVGAPVAHTVIPASFKELEVVTNTGDAAALQEGPLSRALAGLAQELELVPARTRVRQAVRRRRSAAKGDSGQAAIELIPVLAVLMLCFFAALQGVAYGYGYVLTGQAAARAARQLAVGNDPAGGCKSIPSAYGCSVSIDPGGTSVTATLVVPTLLPGRLGPTLTTSVDAGTVVER